MAGNGFISAQRMLSVLSGILVSVPVNAAPPLEYLRGNGAKAYPVVNLTWGLLGISIAVIVIISALVILALWRHSGASDPKPDTRLSVDGSSGGLAWIAAGVGVTGVVLLVTVVWTVKVLGDIKQPTASSPLMIEVTGHQWWWEIRYLSDDPSQIFTTANEIHIPTETPVSIQLKSDDVIHSFWVPALSGKTDAIPGLTNKTWFEAHDLGTYRGQCTEYCGHEHARMGFVVVAQTPEEFSEWRAHQLDPPQDAPGSLEASAGAADFGVYCAACHTIRGTPAKGVVGPNLSHLMQRKTLAGATLPNDSENLLRWISDPQSIKPGSLMPRPMVSPEELDSIRTYLMTLR